MNPFRRRSQTAMQQGGGAAAWTPASIAGLQLWLDASQITGLNDGDAVATWSDLSGNGRHVTQATLSKRPLYKTGIQNGKPALLFDGVDDWLENLSATLTLKNGCSISAVFRATGSVDVWDTVLSKDTGDIVFTQYQSAGLSLANLGVAWIATEGAFGPTVWQAGLGTYDGTTGYVYRNNTQIATGAYASSLLADNTGFYVGRFSPSYSLPDFGGYYGELIVYNRAITAQERLLLAGYVTSKWGTP